MIGCFHIVLILNLCPLPTHPKRVDSLSNCCNGIRRGLSRISFGGVTAAFLTFFFYVWQQVQLVVSRACQIPCVFYLVSFCTSPALQFVDTILLTLFFVDVLYKPRTNFLPQCKIEGLFLVIIRIHAAFAG